MPLVTHALTKLIAHTLYVYMHIMRVHHSTLLHMYCTCATCAAHVQHVLNEYASGTVGINFITLWLAMSSSCHIIHARFIIASVMNWTGKGRQH